MSKIYKFDCDIFPLKIWVAVQPSLQQLQKRFAILDDDNVTEKEFDKDSIKPYWGACRISVVEKESRHVGSIIIVMHPDAYSDRTLVHESCHACDDFILLLDLDVVGETRAYLTEWIFDRAKSVIDKELDV